MSSPRALSLESFRPGPDRVWIRYRPRRWPGPEGIWTDWARRSLGRPRRSDAALPGEPGRVLDDVVYLPPVPAELASARDELAARWRRAGIPLVVQRLPDELPAQADGREGVWDLLPALLTGEFAAMRRLPSGSKAVWPLVAGLTDAEEQVDCGLEALAECGAETVQPMVLELSAAARRQLARDADESAFDRLFHGPQPSARRFSVRAAEHGLSTFVPRPLPATPLRLSVRRRCSGELRLAAELHYRLGRPEADTQRLLRSARWIDREDYDLAALAAEDNLAIVDWFDATSRQVIEEVLSHGRSSLVAELEDAYTRPAAES